MNEKNRLVLHFGMPKTGTTSLQRFLAENRKQLENYGWTYPDFRYPGGVVTRNLDVFLYRPDDTFIETTLNMLENSHVILSSEDAWFALGWGGGQQILKKLYAVWNNLKVIVYLRRQDFYIEALWSQYVRDQQTGLNLKEFEREMSAEWDYGRRLHEIAEIISTENIAVRIYEEEGFDTVQDFLTYLNLNSCRCECGEAGKRVNERTDTECLKLLQICSSVLTKEQSESMKLPVRKIFSEIAGSKRIEDNGSARKYFSPAERERILSVWKKQNDALARKYLGREQLFLNEKIQYPFYDPPVSAMEETIVKMFLLMEVKRRNAMKFFLTNREKKIAFWGAGTRCTEMIRSGLIRPDIIIDNDGNLWGKQLSGVPVVSVADIDELKKYCIVITVEYPQAICEQCRSYGLTEGKEFICGGDIL